MCRKHSGMRRSPTIARSLQYTEVSRLGVSKSILSIAPAMWGDRKLSRYTTIPLIGRGSKLLDCKRPNTFKSVVSTVTSDIPYLGNFVYSDFLFFTIFRSARVLYHETIFVFTQVLDFLARFLFILVPSMLQRRPLLGREIWVANYDQSSRRHQQVKSNRLYHGGRGAR